jgi:hypothetical protein
MVPPLPLFFLYPTIVVVCGLLYATRAIVQISTSFSLMIALHCNRPFSKSNSNLPTRVVCAEYSVVPHCLNYIFDLH